MATPNIDPSRTSSSVATVMKASWAIFGLLDKLDVPVQIDRAFLHLDLVCLQGADVDVGEQLAWLLEHRHQFWRHFLHELGGHVHLHAADVAPGGHVERRSVERTGNDAALQLPLCEARPLMAAIVLRRVYFATDIREEYILVERGDPLHGPERDFARLCYCDGHSIIAR